MMLFQSWFRFNQYLLSGLASLTNGSLGSWETLESRRSSRSLLSSLTSRTLKMSREGESAMVAVMHGVDVTYSCSYVAFSTL